MLQGSKVPVRPTCQSICSTVVNAACAEIYKQLPSVVHDLRNQAAVAVLGHQPSPPCHQFQLASLDVLAEFAHSAAVLLELNYTSTDAQQFGS